MKEAYTHRLIWGFFDPKSGKHIDGVELFCSLEQANEAKRLRKYQMPDCAAIVVPIRRKATPLQKQKKKLTP